MTETQNPRVTAEDQRVAEECVEAWDETRNGFNPCGDRDAGAQVVAAYREAAEAASKAREAALVEALKSAPLIGSTEHPHTFRCRQDVWLRDVFTPVLAALTKEPDA